MAADSLKKFAPAVASRRRRLLQQNLPLDDISLLLGVLSECYLTNSRLETSSPYDQGRYAAVCQHLICPTAKQEPRDTTTTMRRHDNQIAPFAVSGSDNAFRWMLILYVDPIAS